MQTDVNSLALQANWAQASFIKKPWSRVHAVLGLNIPPSLLVACFSPPQVARELMQAQCDAEASSVKLVWKADRGARVCLLPSV